MCALHMRIGSMAYASTAVLFPFLFSHAVRVAVGVCGIVSVHNQVLCIQWCEANPEREGKPEEKNLSWLLAGCEDGTVRARRLRIDRQSDASGVMSQNEPIIGGDRCCDPKEVEIIILVDLLTCVFVLALLGSIVAR